MKKPLLVCLLFSLVFHALADEAGGEKKNTPSWKDTAQAWIVKHKKKIVAGVVIVSIALLIYCAKNGSQSSRSRLGGNEYLKKLDDETAQAQQAADEARKKWNSLGRVGAGSAISDQGSSNTIQKCEQERAAAAKARRGKSHAQMYKEAEQIRARTDAIEADLQARLKKDKQEFDAWNSNKQNVLNSLGDALVQLRSAQVESAAAGAGAESEVDERVAAAHIIQKSWKRRMIMKKAKLIPIPSGLSDAHVEAHARQAIRLLEMQVETDKNIAHIIGAGGNNGNGAVDNS